MANQTDNITLNDDTTGLNRTVNVASDDLFLSVDLTLQSGAILVADNIKRGTADPNVATLAGNEGDLYQRTLASTGQTWVNTDGTTSGWLQLRTSASAWSDVLVAGNTSGGTDPEITSGDSIVGQDQAATTGGDVPITAGSATGGVNNGGDVILSPGSGFGGGTSGIVQVTGPKLDVAGEVNTDTEYQIGDVVILTVDQDLTNVRTASFGSEYDNGSQSGPTYTVDWNNGQKQTILLTGNITTMNLTAPAGVGNFLIRVVQDGTGNRTITWPGTVKWPGGTGPTLSGPDAEDVVTFYYNGTDYYGVASLTFS